MRILEASQRAGGRVHTIDPTTHHTYGANLTRSEDPRPAQARRSRRPPYLKKTSRNFGKSSFRLLILLNQNQDTSESLNSRRKETTSHRSLSQSTSVRLKMMSVTTFLTRSSVTGDGGGMLRVKNIMKCSFQISRVQHQGRAQAAPVSGRLRV